MEKVKFDLTGVPHTLVLPLFGRAIASREKNSKFNDEYAIKLVEALNYDFADLEKRMKEFSTSMSWAADRALYFDNGIKNYLKTHPKATIVNMGAGLETAFYRVDNGQLTWVDLDLPQVMAIKQKLLPPPKRVHYIAKSVLDFSWMDDVKKFGDDVYFFAGGLFIYLKPEQVKSLFIEMAHRFKNAELQFDTIEAADLMKANEMFKTFKMQDIKLQWGFNRKEVETWSPKLNIMSHVCDNSHEKTMKDGAKPPFKGYMTKVGLSMMNCQK